MSLYICKHTLVPMRMEPDHRSEMVSQILFGEYAQIIEEYKNWVKIRLEFDGYKGWVEREIPEPSPDPVQEKLIISRPLITAGNNGQSVYLPAGAEIPLPDKGGIFRFSNQEFHLKGRFTGPNEKITAIAGKFEYAPYLWGGRTVFGIDCSGFVQLVHKIRGITLPRDASQQEETGMLLKSCDELREGDLMFFTNEKDSITHVGIYLGNKRIIHASKSVRTDTVDEKGIYNKELKKYSHLLHSCKRVIF